MRTRHMFCPCAHAAVWLDSSKTLQLLQLMQVSLASLVVFMWKEVLAEEEEAARDTIASSKSAARLPRIDIVENVARKLGLETSA